MRHGLVTVTYCDSAVSEGGAVTYYSCFSTATISQLSTGIIYRGQLRLSHIKVSEARPVGLALTSATFNYEVQGTSSSFYILQLVIILDIDVKIYAARVLEPLYCHCDRIANWTYLLS